MNENENNVTPKSEVTIESKTENKPEVQSGDETYIKKLRDEAASERTKRQELEKTMADLKKFKEDREREELESEKKFKELADKERQAREDDSKKFKEELTKREQRFILAELKAEAVKAGILPEAIADLKLLANLSELTIDENDEVVGLSDFITKLKETKSYMFTKAESEEKPKRERATPPPSQKGEKPELNISNMSDEEWQAYKNSKLNRFSRF